MLKISEELEQMSASGDFGVAPDGAHERVAALEIERDALKAELEAAKENHRIHAARLISEKILVSEQLEAARKQEPAVLIEGKKIFWNPEYKGVHEGGFYANPVPTQQAAEPIAFTENDLLEIASSYSAYAGADGDMYLDGWVKSYEAKGFISLINNRQRG